MKKIYAITFFSALLVLGNENNILANSNLSSLETNDLIVTETNNSTFEEIETFLDKKCMNGDLLITMGAGNVVEIGESLLGR